MSAVERFGEGFVIDAEILGESFGIPPADVPALMREGAITSRTEAGVDEDRGRWRITLRYRRRNLRLIVDDAGNILKRANFGAGRRADRASGAA